ncbi:putative UPF0481 protein [Dichanthelium oligosanthes]|uniref:Putative UPF0481 protein n=1 Tax=Dichanthelium oligosanthes TaxID=888268 RepID=A0A1E5V2T0_9POAL|nr:putative UPF0481 protein [Dichanthelium oligosanthes]
MAFSEPQPRARLEMAAAADTEFEEQTDEEVRWVFRVQRSLEQTPEALGAPAKVFNVPHTLRDTKPEAYAPHFFALGPYHQARPELMDMERFKLAGAKRLEMLFTGGRKMEHLMVSFQDDGIEQKIRSTYHRTLSQSRRTLAWMMAIDACFLLDFIENYHRHESTDVVSSSANWINAVVRDAMMLENQIPLFVFAKALELRHATRREAAKALHAIVDRFIKDVSPIKISHKQHNAIGDLSKHAHLLELLYHFLVPDATIVDDNNSGDHEQEPQPTADEELIISHDDDIVMPLQDQAGYDTMKQAFSQASSLNIAPVRFIKKNLISRPMALVSTLSGKIARKAPALAALVPVIGKLVLSVDVEAQLNTTDQQGAEGGLVDAPRADEIHVPSVEQLARCGVRFTQTQEGIAGIGFDRATATLRLPVIVLDANTEVVLRNLVAYEAVAVRGPLALARYTELMNGIVDTSKDVKILRRSRVVVSHMKSNKDAAGMWNGMARATRLSKVPRIDAVIAAVNAHRGRSAAVRAQKLLKKYVFRSWKMLTLLASVGLLVMTALQTFCSAYPCDNRWFVGGVVPGADDPAAR